MTPTRAIPTTIALIATTALPEYAEARCPTYTPGEPIGALQDERLDEVSGLARSWRNEGIFWVHNDSGDSARIFAIDLTGATHTEVLVDGAKAVDWEDIAVGPCDVDGGPSCIWIGDIGDNNEQRTDIVIYRVPEPLLTAPYPAELRVTADAFPIAYRDGSRNAETLMAHPKSGELYIVDKTNGAPSSLWHVHLNGNPATKLGEFAPGELALFGNRVTAGEFAPNGTEFSIRTYTHVYTFCGDDPASAFNSRPRAVAATDLAQAEALTYSADGKTLYTTSEVRGDAVPPILAMTQIEPTPRPKQRLTQPRQERVEAPRGCSCSTSSPSAGYAVFAVLAVLFRTRLRRR